MDVTAWLLDGDPAIRWQVLRDLTDAPKEEVAAERARVTSHGWGALLLAAQAADGHWGGGTYFPSWTSTAHTLNLLRLLGAEPGDPAVRDAVDRVDAGCRWEYDDLPFFSGEVEPCINGLAVALGGYFGKNVDGIVERLLGEQMADGGWNCDQERGSVRGSFHTTIAVLEGLTAYRRGAATHDVTAALRDGDEYLLRRRLLRRASTGELVDVAWTRPAFPPYYFYDVLRGLDHLRDRDTPPEDRMAEAIGLIEEQRGEDGRWRVATVHPGDVHVAVDAAPGEPSRWNTLRAMRVLRWYRQGA